MAVQIPPWLNIDPIEPARIAQRANAQRGAQAIAERNAQIQYQRLQQEQEMNDARLAAQERASVRHADVLKQTRDAELAQHAAALQMRREEAAQRAKQYERQLKIREQKAEQEVKEASERMEGSRGLQEDLQGGVPMDKAMAKWAPKLFYKNPERIGQAMRGLTPPEAPQEFTTAGGVKGVYNTRTGAPSFPPREAAGPLGPEAFTARPIVDAQGKPMGFNAIPGHGAARVLPGAMNAAPKDVIHGLTALLIINKRAISDSTDPKEVEALKEERKQLIADLKKMTALPPAKVAGKEMETGEYPEEGENAVLADEEEELAPAEEEVAADEEDLMAEEEP